eukprot:6589252-Alexandrium_andersonii.AAC.1
MGPTVTARTWRSHLAAASWAHWILDWDRPDEARRCPADLFRRLVAWAGTKLRPHLDTLAGQSHRYHTLNAVAVFLAHSVDTAGDHAEGWVRDLTEDGD